MTFNQIQNYYKQILGKEFIEERVSSHRVSRKNYMGILTPNNIKHRVEFFLS